MVWLRWLNILHDVRILIFFMDNHHVDICIADSIGLALIMPRSITKFTLIIILLSKDSNNKQVISHIVYGGGHSQPIGIWILIGERYQHFIL